MLHYRKDLPKKNLSYYSNLNKNNTQIECFGKKNFLQISDKYFPTQNGNE